MYVHVFQADCPAGTFLNNDECTECSYDSYQPDIRQYSCDSCGDAQITLQTGSTMQAQCCESNLKKNRRGLFSISKNTLQFVVWSSFLCCCFTVDAVFYSLQVDVTYTGDDYQYSAILQQEGSPEFIAEQERICSQVSDACTARYAANGLAMLKQVFKKVCIH